MLQKSILALSLLICSSVFASLGDDESSIQKDNTRLGGTHIKKQVQQQLFSVHELQSDNGATIKEYVSPQGKVFAVTWKGPLMPDLNQLLGQYFQPYVDTLKADGKRHHGVVHVEQPNFVVHSSGRLRAFSGLAYLPQALPQGVKIEDLQ